MKIIMNMLIFLSVIFCAMLNAETDFESEFYKGGTFYEQGEYQKALNSYLDLYNSGYESPNLLYNIGNCYLKLGMIGETILYYERCKKIDPSLSELLFNLEHTKSFQKDNVIWESQSWFGKRL